MFASVTLMFTWRLVELILRHNDNLSKTLQSTTLSQSRGKILVNMTVKELEKLRNESNSNIFWDNVNAKAKSFEVDKLKLPRKWGAPKKVEDFYEFGPAKPAQPDEPKDLYRKHYYEALYHFINCIKERFNQEDFRNILFYKKSFWKQPGSSHSM